MLPVLPSCYRAGTSMAVEFAAFMVLALALGFKHSYDADHLVAVSNLITRSGSVRKTSLMSASWAAGHMVTAAIITVLLYTFRQTVLTEFLAHLDLLVAVMLLGIGVVGLLWEFNGCRPPSDFVSAVGTRRILYSRPGIRRPRRGGSAWWSVGLIGLRRDRPTALLRHPEVTGSNPVPDIPDDRPDATSNARGDPPLGSVCNKRCYTRRNILMGRAAPENQRFGSVTKPSVRRGTRWSTNRRTRCLDGNSCMERRWGPRRSEPSRRPRTSSA